MAGHDLAGADVHGHEADDLEVVGKKDQLPAQRGRAAAAPRQTAAGSGCALAAVLCAHAVIGGAPDDLYAAVCPQQVAGEVREDDCALPAGGDAVFSTLAGGGGVDVHLAAEVGGAACKDGVDGCAGDIAHRTLLATAGVDAEAAGDEPEVAVVIKDDGEQILLKTAAQHPLGSLLDVDVQHLLEDGQRRAALVRGPQHQDVVVAGGADDEVAPVHEGIGALDEVAAAVMFCGGEKADGPYLLCVEVADGQTAEEGADGVVEVVEEDGGGGIGVRLFHRHMDLGADAYGEDGVGGVGVVAVVVDVRLAAAHKGVRIHALCRQGLQRQGGVFAVEKAGQQAVGLGRAGGGGQRTGQQSESGSAEEAASGHFHGGVLLFYSVMKCLAGIIKALPLGELSPKVTERARMRRERL